MSEPTPAAWLSTKDACERLGITLRTLYRFIDEGRLTAYQMGRVIRIQQGDLDTFIAAARISPGSLAHLYPDTRPPGEPLSPDGEEPEVGEPEAGEPGA